MIRKLMRVNGTLLGRDRSLWVITATLLVWGVWEESLNPSSLSFAAYLVPILVVWVAAYGVRDDLERGGFDLILTRGVTLPGLILSRALVSVALGWFLLVALALPAMRGGGWEWGGLLGIAVAVVYWVAVGSALSMRMSAPGVVLLGAAATAFCLLWIFSICPRLTGEMASSWPWLLVTWPLQVVADYFPGAQLTLLREGGLGWMMDLSRAAVGCAVLVLAAWWADRCSLPAGR